MRILSLAPTSFFGDYGCHVRILEEARALRALGHEVTIVTYYKGSDVPDVPIIRSAPTPWRSHYEVGSSRHKYAFDVLLTLKLMQVLARQRFDVIHAHLHEGALIGSVVGRLFGVPVAFDYQGSLSDEIVQHNFVRAGSLSHRFFARLERVINRLPRVIFTSTHHAAAQLSAALGNRARVFPLPDGVNTKVFHPRVITPEARAALRAQLGINPNEPVVVFLGLLAAHQGIQHLIEAAAILQQQGVHARWLVMGYPSEAHWRAQAQQAGVGQTMIFTGRVPYADAPRMLALGDIAVAPKRSLTEGSGKLLNYMAMGLPVVAFDTPAQREYLGALGVYAPVGDSAALAHHVAALLAAPEQRRRLGEQLRDLAVRNYSWERAAQVMLKGYCYLLGDRAVLPRDIPCAVISRREDS
ncbi:MAG: glycosyltransferase family 4 protein [Thermoflexales bacterium]|nr:glycosyltransferase family 4 protein [Thermoflexales bacterium]MCS7325153.1 glycosyltransferase family 4 protein [Thermoflexales bacterium]MDW8054448.1 glycosyltransferase family 4 protein [Anaerolineae bacterium]